MSKRRGDWGDFEPEKSRASELWRAALEMSGGDKEEAEKIYQYFIGMDRESFDEDRGEDRDDNHPKGKSR